MTSKQQEKQMQEFEKISIIILNWNGKHDTAACLNSLKDITYPNYEVVVVDNGSTDGSVTFLKKRFPKITFLENKENLGFTGGNNRGIKYAMEHGAKYVVLLNNDTTVKENLLEEMYAIFKNDAKVGLVGPRVVHFDDPEKVWCAGGNYNRFLGKAKMYGAELQGDFDFNSQSVVDWISFCVVMIKTDVLEKIGLLDDDYFFTSEDVDFCRRAIAHGFKCVYAPNAIVKHKISQDSGGLDSPFNIYYQVRNKMLFYKKNRSIPGFIVSSIYYLGLSLPYRSLGFFRDGYFKRIKFIFTGLADFIAGNVGKGKRTKFPKRKTKTHIGINARYLQRSKSGIERYVEELVVNMTNEDKESQYFLFFNNHVDVPNLNLPDNVSVIKANFPTGSTVTRLLWENFFLYFQLKKHNIDLFHGPAFFLPFFKPKKCVYVATVHDITFAKFPESFTFATGVYYKLFFSRSVKLANRIISDSVSTKNDLIKVYKTPEEKNDVVYLGLSKNFLENQSEEKVNHVRKRYNLPEKYFLFTGVLSPRKNVERIISVYAKIHKQEKYKEYKLVVVGRKGWLYEDIFKKVKNLGLEQSIIFVDFVEEEDLPAVYKAAQILLFPSLYEGFGFPILEAMAQECPVITSKISSMPEVAGDAARLVDPLNEKEIEIAITTLIENPPIRDDLVKKGLKQVKKFTWEKTAKETREVYVRAM